MPQRVIPAKAGIHYPEKTWTPAFAGVTGLFSGLLIDREMFTSCQVRNVTF